jgi:sialic acid synthase SpsE
MAGSLRSKRIDVTGTSGKLFEGQTNSAATVQSPSLLSQLSRSSVFLIGSSSCAVAAVALGACVIEKHFKRADGGPDSAFSLEPNEFKHLVDDCRNAWLSLGRIDYSRSDDERSNNLFHRSLYVVENVPPGGQLTSNNVRCIRPGLGLPPKYLPQVIGCRAVRALKRGEPLTWKDVDSR